ncbi:S-adenosyl-L-methionine-dependent methyltransferase [Scheffersomyces coipomensis]|uniref:S-adenosyl-L-methionine-dependent methyltransferase n=1 Tax=Scheffersomyces coipomensis TaxID=1788519 RepID=UPI00315DEE3B
MIRGLGMRIPSGIIKRSTILSTTCRYPGIISIGSIHRLSTKPTDPSHSKPSSSSSSNPFPIDPKHIQRQKQEEKLSTIQKWAKYFESEEFKRGGLTYYYVGAGICVIIAFYYYMRDRYYEDIQIKHVKAKYEQDPKSLLEYEFLMMKRLNNEKLRPKEDKKFKIYQMMRKEFRRKNLLNKDAIFEPTPEELEEWYQKQPRRSIKKAPILDEPIDKKDEVIEPEVKGNDNVSIVPAEDTTEFFEQKAATYDDAIKWEERGVLMGRRRQWLMKQVHGDVLEVACGTGRNIPYLYPELINSITFLDSSSRMVELASKKFQSYFPSFKKVGFTVGKAEDLINLVKENQAIKYDTIIETFGLCAHEDPVQALKNMKELLKPGGRIILLEHGRSTWGFINNHLDFRSERRMKTWGCRWNLDIPELIDDAGLDITYEKRVHLGTTYMLICKKPEDPMNQNEKPFINKLFGKDVSKPIEK